MANTLRVLIADDERPARAMLASLLRDADATSLVGEATNGAEAVRLIEAKRPDLALLDLQMPEVDGLGVVRLVRKEHLPLVAFVTAYDEYAIKAFELNAVDYLLKPVDRARLHQTLSRARERLVRPIARDRHTDAVKAAVHDYEQTRTLPIVSRIPVRKRDNVILVPVSQVASAVADGELLHLMTMKGERHTITYSLKDLEARLDPARFVRLERGAIVNIDAIARVSALPGGSYLVSLVNGQEIRASRLQSRVLRDQLLRL
jgi:two-component system LytT family response regulator